MDKTSADAATSLFQTFGEIGGPEHSAERIEALRHELEKRDLWGFLVPRSDRHQNEYVPPSQERLLWLTGFSGSAGLAVVLRDRAALFVDGRYTVQAAAQIDGAVLDLKHTAETTPTAWLSQYLKRDGRIGFDPWLHTAEAIERFSQACLAAGATLSPVDLNPIDAIWSDRPPAPLAPVVIHPIKLAGESSSSKLARAQEKIASWDGLIVSDPHNAAWLFNIRGHDVAHTPLPLSFAYVPKSGPPTLFVDGRKLSISTSARLSAVSALSEPESLLSFVEDLGRKAARIALDAATSPVILKRVLEANGGVGAWGPTITLLKSRKNTVELAGTEQAHLRDGAALVRFLEWFDRKAPRGTVTEISAAIELERFRRETGALEDISFPTISAAGPHAAMPHYRVSKSSNAMVGRGLFLIDSGGQYRDGTTDITRTICVGAASGEMRDQFTRVLKGHIAVARATFPVGTTGAQLDSLARRELWAAGLDFDHGTGHGVGVYLSVHEGPQRIAKTGAVALEPGMIVSNEPGYYAVGRFGIRIENLIVVEPRKIIGAEREMLGFRTLSLAPIDTRAVNPRLLDLRKNSGSTTITAACAKRSRLCSIARRGPG